MRVSGRRRRHDGTTIYWSTTPWADPLRTFSGRPGNASVDKSRVTFHPAAEIELYDAALYYESQRFGLGSTFLQAIEKRWPKFTKTRWRVHGSRVSCEANGCGGSPIRSCTPLRWRSPDSRHRSADRFYWLDVNESRPFRRSVDDQ